MPISFTQYVLPSGRRKFVEIARPEAIENMARAIEASGHRFEVEILTTGEISLTIHSTDDDDDVDIEVVANGPAVTEAVDRMVERFFARSNPHTCPRCDEPNPDRDDMDGCRDLDCPERY